MLFNCLECAKSISTRMDHCPYCLTKTAQIGTTIETAQRKEKEETGTLWERLRGTVSSVVLGDAKG